MRLFRTYLPNSSFERMRDSFRASSLKTRLMIGLIPPVVVIMVITGYITYDYSKQSINTAVERTTRLQAVAVGNEIESYLDRCRQDLVNLAQEDITPGLLARFLGRNQTSGGIEYTEAAFIAQKSAGHLVYIARDGRIVQIPSGMTAAIKPNPLAYFDETAKLKAGEVWLSPVLEVESPFPDPDNPNQKIVRKVMRLVTPCCGEGSSSGYLMVSIDTRNLRNILSLYNSSRSPIGAYPRTAEERFMFLFDTDGWMLLQSESVDKPQMELTTHLARSGYTGTLGRPGLESAFRPDSIYEVYWKMVEDVRDARQDVVSLTAYQPNAHGRSYFLAYAPVRFRAGADTRPQVVAGIAYMDISRLTLLAGYKHADVMFYITVATALIVGAFIYVLGRIITRPILKLAEAVNEMPEQGRLVPIDLPYYGREIKTLQRAINALIAALQRQVEEIREKDRAIRSVTLKEQAFVASAPAETAPPAEDPIPAIVGAGPRVDRLKQEILKAAQVEADVLIIGETGTGKQLAAEAIHRLSSRSNAPFISINCGALDENLLLDTLFGHVKGAFTEAKTDRKGAFLEADRGTLFLDEIQVASPRVQQAMLRAIAVRQVKPLGSDRETGVDVRLIVATNVDLRDLIQKGIFREDLYFRLKVISLETIPLREQKENLPLLTRHFLKAQELRTGRVGLGLSKGALSKIESYDWPGNVRELQNCLTRAAIMAERPLIQAEDIPIEVDGWEQECALPEAGPPAAALPELSRRQQKALPQILARGRITRSDYQAFVGDDLPVRTAIYDLQDLVRKGVLKKTGSGPATFYVVDPRFSC